MPGNPIPAGQAVGALLLRLAAVRTSAAADLALAGDLPGAALALSEADNARQAAQGALEAAAMQAGGVRG